MGTGVRRGLPRHAGGEPWPPADFTASGPTTSVVGSEPASAQAAAGPAPAPTASLAEAVPGPTASVGEAGPAPTASVRRGLPREAGGEPWPPASFVPQGSTAPVAPSAVAAPAEPLPAAATATLVEGSPAVVGVGAETQGGAAGRASSSAVRPVRRGLPRVPGGEPWPPAAPTVQTPVVGGAPSGLEDSAPTATLPGPDEPAGSGAAVGPVEPAAAGEPATAAAAPAAAAVAMTPSLASPVRPETPPGASTPAASAPVGSAPAVSTPAASTPAASTPTAPTPTKPVPATSSSAAKPALRPTLEPTAKAPRLFGPYTAVQLGGVALVGAVAVLAVAGAVVLAVRWFLGLDFMVDFMARYPGEYHLPEAAPVGFPAWLGWQHFFNAFLMVLVIQTGIRIRREERPAGYWQRRPDRPKIALSVWLHQSLDMLWLVNGVLFVVLLATTGQWMRIVPTSWEVFPNAVSALLQYLSLDWPTENGWVNYNSLQQLAYFTTVFVAAPLAALTGWRMGSLWPARATGLDRAFPLEWARRLHFPVMIYFVVFIAIHVTLVFATGALRNLNHMYAAQGSPDPQAYAANWAGFWIFVASLAVTVAAAVAARPSLVAPVAGLFGKVSRR